MAAEAFFEGRHVELAVFGDAAVGGEAADDVNAHVVFFGPATQLELPFIEVEEGELDFLLRHNSLLLWVDDLHEEVNLLFQSSRVEFHQAVELDEFLPADLALLEV